MEDMKDNSYKVYCSDGVLNTGDMNPTEELTEELIKRFLYFDGTDYHSYLTMFTYNRLVTRHLLKLLGLGDLYGSLEEYINIDLVNALPDGNKLLGSGVTYSMAASILGGIESYTCEEIFEEQINESI